MPKATAVSIPDSYHNMLAQGRFGILSTLRHSDGFISSNPVGYVWDGEHIRISSLKSRVKYANLQANPMLSFCLVSQHNVMEYIEIRGHATLEDDDDRSFFRQQYQLGAGEDPPEDLDAAGARRIIITIHPQQISSPTLYGGRFNK